MRRDCECCRTDGLNSIPRTTKTKTSERIRIPFVKERCCWRKNCEPQKLDQGSTRTIKTSLQPYACSPSQIISSILIIHQLTIFLQTDSYYLSVDNSRFPRKESEIGRDLGNILAEWKPSKAHDSKKVLSKIWAWREAESALWLIFSIRLRIM